MAKKCYEEHAKNSPLLPGMNDGMRYQKHLLQYLDNTSGGVLKIVGCRCGGFIEIPNGKERKTFRFNLIRKKGEEKCSAYFYSLKNKDELLKVLGNKR